MKKICHPSQASFFDLLKDLRPKTEISVLNTDLLFRTALAKAIKESNLSRTEIAIEMSKALGVPITKVMIDSWTAESREGVNRFPACYLPAFCQIVGSREPMKILADLIGCFVVEGQDALLIELAKVESEKQKLNEKERAIKLILNGAKQ